MTNKGTPEEIIPGITDHKTKEPLMIALAYQNQTLTLIGTISALPTIITPPLFILPPKIAVFQNNISKVN